MSVSKISDILSRIEQTTPDPIPAVLPTTAERTAAVFREAEMYFQPLFPKIQNTDSSASIGEREHEALKKMEAFVFEPPETPAFLLDFDVSRFLKS